MIRDRRFPTACQHWSELKQMGRSPMHYRAAYESPTEQTPAMRFGVLVHAILLGGDYLVYEGERRGAAWKAVAEANPDRLIVTASEFERANAIADAVRANPLAAPLLVGKREIDLTWDWAGVKCGGRIDVIGDGFVTELKTANSAEPEAFARAARRMHYHGQLGWYRNGARFNGFRVDACFIVCVETAAPYPVTVMRVTERAMLEGEKCARAWLERVQVCREANEWPGYSQCIETLDVLDDDEPLIIDGEEIAA